MSDAPAPPPATLAPPRNAFGFRFAVVYGALAAVAVVAVTVLVVVARQPGHPRPPTWSAWKPASGSASKMAQEIAEHLAPRYKATAGGEQLVAVISSSPEVTRGTKATEVSTIGFLESASADCCARVIDTSGNLQAQLCGIGPECSISAGSPSAARERLVRREALELALYTFKYVPSIKAVIAYLPPPAGQNPSSLLYLEKSNLSKELRTPIRQTLPADPPPLPSQLSSSEKSTIDRLTQPVLYSFQVQGLRDGTDALVLTPAGT